jgi:hypothetical protein
MNNVEKCAEYPFPLPGIRDEYRADIVENREGWTQTTVSVKHCLDMAHRELESSWQEISVYQRNYSMLKTFEPFRQLKDGVWLDYALISTKYTRLEVMDLQTGEIIAVEPYPKASKELAEKFPEKYVEGQDMPGQGFCPAEFFVPSWWDEYDEADKDQSRTWPGIPDEINQNVAGEYLDEWKLYEGNWGVYSGCVWGDDTSWKVRYVDLSRISEGIVTTDDRFGYVSLPGDTDLKKAVKVMPENGTIEVKVPVEFSLETGKAKYKKWTVDQFNWEIVE